MDYSGRTSRNSRRRKGFAFWLPFAIIAALMLLGGASRMDTMSQIFCQLAALTGGIALIVGRVEPKAAVPAAAWWPIAAITALCIVQLVPLPPAIWTSFPGRDAIATADAALGLHQWRPLSYYPQATLATLIGMIAPLVGLLAVRAISIDDHRLLCRGILAVMAVSALLGIIQTSIGLPYFYEITNRGSGVGIFANRNHQAIFLACSLPLITMTAMAEERRVRSMTRVWLIAGFSALIVLVAVLLNASRIGLVTYVLAAAGSLLMFVTSDDAGPRNGSVAANSTDRKKIWLIAGGVLAATLLAIFLVQSRLPGISRIAQTDLSSEGRIKYLPALWETLRSVFPVGAGFGAFDRAYRMHEPFGSLTAAYLNHAHNDYLELVIEAGLPGILAAVIAGGLIILLLKRVWVPLRPDTARGKLAPRAASIVLVCLLVGSITDYPLRTPALAVLAVGMLVVMGGMGTAHRRQRV